MAQSLPRLSVPAVLALGSAALGAAFATGLLLGELRQSREWEGAEQSPRTLSEPQALIWHPFPGRETVAPVGVQTTTAPAAPRGQSPVAVSAEPLHAGAPGAAKPATGQ